MFLRALGLVALLLPVIAVPAAASTPTMLTINGGGFGDGIGMSQYGALGDALHHWNDRQILSHYFSGTKLGSVNFNETVTVLLGDGAAGFRGATSANGRRLAAGTTYTVRPGGSDGDLVLAAGRDTIATVRPPLTVKGAGPLEATGYGSVEGSLVFRPDGREVETVNALGLDQYVGGVVAEEMPSSWPTAALEAQAIAVRTYAITAGSVSPDYELYSDTRSQVYGGLGAETPRTNAAVRATRGSVVEYHGAPAFTPYCASSGGHTESIQNVWVGATPDPWLRGVPDPYDDAASDPYYRWSMQIPVSEVSARLAGYLRGRFEGITITRRGVSKRVVDAEVLGSGGRVAITGEELQARLGTMSTLMSFSLSGH